jgi:hypothetical protein
MTRTSSPPVEHRFKKGQSGNPKGRPKKPTVSAKSAFEIIMDRTLSVTRDGVPTQVGIEEALQLRTYQAAIAGKRAAQKQILKMILKREEAIAKSARQDTKPIKRLIEKNPENACEALTLLRITTPSKKWGDSFDSPLNDQMESWAVNLALSRRQGRKGLSEEDVRIIRDATRDPENIKWPKGTVA